MQPQVKERWQLPKAGRVTGGLSSRSSRGSVTLPTRWFQTSGLQNCERIHFCCFKPPSWSNLLQKPQETNIVLRIHLTIPLPVWRSTRGFPQSPLGSCQRMKGCRIMLICGRHSTLPKREKHRTGQEPLWYLIHFVGLLIHWQFRVRLGIKTGKCF